MKNLLFSSMFIIILLIISFSKINDHEEVIPADRIVLAVWVESYDHLIENIKKRKKK